MSVSAAALRELHRIHRQLTDLRSRLKRGPRQVKAAEANVQRLQSQLEKAKEAALRARMTADEKELQLKEREGRIEDIKARLNSCNSNREYQTFLEQIAADEQANSVLSDEILELLDKTSELQDEVGRASRELDKGSQELESVRQRVDADRISLETELGRLTSELNAAEDQLPSEFKPEYERLVKSRGDEALAPLDGECCGGCFQTVTPQMINELMLSKPVFCKSCGCLLYLPESQGNP